MVPIAQKLEYVFKDKESRLPVTSLYKRDNLTNDSAYAPFVDYETELNTNKNSAEIDFLMEIRRNNTFRKTLHKAMVDIFNEYTDLDELPSQIGYKLTVLFDFPQEARLPSYVRFLVTYNTYTDEIGIGINYDEGKDYLKW